MWGKIKNYGDDWMYPKRMMDLRFALSQDSTDCVYCFDDKRYNSLCMQWLELALDGFMKHASF